MNPVVAKNIRGIGIPTPQPVQTPTAESTESCLRDEAL